MLTLRECSSIVKEAHGKLLSETDLSKELIEELFEVARKYTRIHEEQRVKDKRANAISEAKKGVLHSSVIVSDHAIKRFLERFRPQDYKLIKEALGEEVFKDKEVVEDGHYLIFDDSKTIVIKNGIVVTVYRGTQRDKEKVNGKH